MGQEEMEARRTRAGARTVVVVVVVVVGRGVGLVEEKETMGNVEVCVGHTTSPSASRRDTWGVAATGEGEGDRCLRRGSSGGCARPPRSPRLPRAPCTSRMGQQELHGAAHAQATLRVRVVKQKCTPCYSTMV